VIDHVIERLASQGDAQTRHGAEVGRTQSTRVMRLCEDHLLGRPRRRRPLMKPTLKRP
jgi:hypothetical protein